MIEKIGWRHGDEEFEVTCDLCDHFEEFNVEYGWDELMREMKNNGWVNKKVDGDWEHYCITCSSNQHTMSAVDDFS